MMKRTLERIKPGAWSDEPDRELGTHAGLRYLILRHDSLKHLCGYVEVPAGCPLFAFDTESDQLATITIHGGLTFAGAFPGRESQLKGGWWFGFDCAHAGDCSPGVLILTVTPLTARTEVYRDIAFVRGQCHHLAEQLAGILTLQKGAS